MTYSMDLNAEKRGNYLLLKLKGKLDAISSPPTEKGIFEHIDKGNHRIILNLSSVDYLSSAGLRTLLTVSKALNQNKGGLILTHINPNVKDVLKMSGFDQMLKICSTDDEALLI